MRVTELAAGRVRLHLLPDERCWVEAAVQAIALPLGEGLGVRTRGGLLLSGGNTPAPVYSALSRHALDWPDMTVSLVDERFLPEGDPARNDGLVRRSLLQHAAENAVFVPLMTAGDTLDAAVTAANRTIPPPTVVVLGMGDDGHTASLFPGMAGLDAALASKDAYVGVDASGCPGAQRWPLRISLTPAGLAPASTRILLIRGESKRALLERVLSGEDVREYPVRMAWMTPGAGLDVYWCP